MKSDHPLAAVVIPVGDFRGKTLGEVPLYELKRLRDFFDDGADIRAQYEALRLSIAAVLESREDAPTGPLEDRIPDSLPWPEEFP